MGECVVVIGVSQKAIRVRPQDILWPVPTRVDIKSPQASVVTGVGCALGLKLVKSSKLGVQPLVDRGRASHERSRRSAAGPNYFADLAARDVAARDAQDLMYGKPLHLWTKSRLRGKLQA